MKYGPQTAEIESLLSKLREITPAQVEALGSAQAAAWDGDRVAVWNEAWEAARNAILDAARGAAWDATLDATRGAARDAVLALLVKDLLPDEHFQTLYGPWASVMD